MLSVSATTPCSKAALVDRCLCPTPTACIRQTTVQLLTKAWSMPKLLCSEVDTVKVGAS